LFASRCRHWCSDLRPSRQEIEALLNGTSLNIAARRAVVDAFETWGIWLRSLLNHPACGQLPLINHDLDIALARFDEQTRTTVMAVLSQVGALA